MSASCPSRPKKKALNRGGTNFSSLRKKKFIISKRMKATIPATTADAPENTKTSWENWMRWSHHHNHDISSESSSKSYEALLEDLIQKSLEKSVAESLKQIELDVPRTFPNDKDFVHNGRMIAPLRRILQALSASSTVKGYTQGMNFLVGFLLKHQMMLMKMPTLTRASEAECYSLSKTFIEHVLTGYYFISDEKKSENNAWFALKRDLKVLDEKTKRLFPRLHETLSANGFSVTFFCPRWFLCAFIGVLPDEVVKKVFDALLFHLWTQKQQQQQQQQRATTSSSSPLASGCCSEMLVAFSLTTLSFVQDELDARRTGDVDCEAIVLAIKDATKSIDGEVFMKRFAEISFSSRSSSLENTKEEGRKITKTRKRTRYEEDDDDEEEQKEVNARMKTPKTASLMGSKKYNHLQPTPLAPPIGSAVKRVLTPIANYFFSINPNDEPAQPQQKSPAMKTATTTAKTPQSSRLKATYAISTNKKRRMETVRTFETPIDDPEGYERDLLELLRAEEHQAMTPVRKITIASVGDENCCDTIPTMAVGFFSPRAAKELGPEARRLETIRSPLSPLMSFR